MSQLALMYTIHAFLRFAYMTMGYIFMYHVLIKGVTYFPQDIVSAIMSLSIGARACASFVMYVIL